jgi:hypothetical protein
MASQMVSVKFPTGETESHITADVPKVGETFKRGDSEWHVIDVAADEHGRAVVTLGPIEGGVLTLTSLDGGTTGLGASGAGIPPDARA